MQFDLVSPERLLASMDATAVQIPGTEGDMTVMADHAPVITTLRPGILKVEGTNGEQDFVVTGGFAEVSPAGVSVLAEMAVAKADAKAEMVEGLLEGARAKVAEASGDAKDTADKYLADLEAMKAAAGL